MMDCQDQLSVRHQCRLLGLDRRGLYFTRRLDRTPGQSRSASAAFIASRISQCTLNRLQPSPMLHR